MRRAVVHLESSTVFWRVARVLWWRDVDGGAGVEVDMPKVRAGARSRSRRGTCGSRRGRAGCTFQRDVCRRCGRCGSGARASRMKVEERAVAVVKDAYGRTTRTTVLFRPFVQVTGDRGS
jgi:hypothetical protein